MNKHIKLSIILGYGGSHIHIFREALPEVAKRFRVEYIVTTDEKSPHYVEFIRSSNAILIYAHELPAEVVEAIRSSNARVVLSFTEYFQELSRGVAILPDAWKYFKLGGRENIKSLIELILKHLGLPAEPSPPVEIPWHGIWHPRLGVFTTTREYLNKYPYANNPLVAILFYRSQWLTGNVSYVEALVNALESEGLGALPMFVYGFKDYMLNTPTIEDSIREFLIVDGKPVIDAAIVLTSFFVLNHGKWHAEESKKSFAVVRGVELLKSLGVPIIKPILEHYQSTSEWLANPAGVSPFTQVYHVIMPEVDGAVEPIFIAGAKKLEDGSKVYEPFNEHVRLIARRVRKWVELRRSKPSERRIAIVLNNPPCRGVEASIGVGYGLDVPETLVRILHRLAELGYNVSDSSKLPKSGKELMSLFFEKRATSEFRWTSVEDIVKRGGYVDMVPLELYMQWFNELPKEVRNEMVKEWGNPEELVRGRAEKVFAGGVYEGKFVVPGLRFGNVVIIPQPKFGCVGAGCDGRICKILHNPTIPPPHQWLAVYRWITRVFKAHLILHVGTHGYLEFRPGKGVGLSPWCWPEISIDDVPFLYIYIVSNPMEGVIAKRRGYATIVDHLYPPMMDARGGLEELDRLVEEYERVIRLGELHRAKVVYSQLVSKVKELGLSIDVSEPEEKVVESVHRYLDMVRSSQVEDGLHIFGKADYDSMKLAKAAATVMEFDTPSWRSILRAVAAYLGLDYDDIISNPAGFYKHLGVSNRKAREVLMEIAQKALEKLFAMGISDDTLSWDVLESVLKESIFQVLGPKILSEAG
jgi:cobaltochelatase CobN